MRHIHDDEAVERQPLPHREDPRDRRPPVVRHEQPPLCPERVEQGGGVFDEMIDVIRVARQYIDLNKLTMVIVGDRKTIEPGLRALKPGVIIMRETRDVLGAPPTP